MAFPLSSCHILNPLLSFRVFTPPSPGKDSVSRNYFLCSSIRNNSPPTNVFSWDGGGSVTPSIASLVPLLFPHLQWSPPPTSGNSQSHHWGLGSTASKLPLILTFLLLPMNYSAPSGIWSLESFQKAFYLFCSDLWEESLFVAAKACEMFV